MQEGLVKGGLDCNNGSPLAAVLHSLHIRYMFVVQLFDTILDQYRIS